MKRKYVLLSMVSRKKLTKESYGRNILSLIYNYNPKIIPEYSNFYEPINKPISTIESALSYWKEESFLCRRRHSIQMLGMIGYDRNKIAIISFDYNWSRNINWFYLFEQLIYLSESYYGYVHVFTDREIEPAAIGSSIHAFLNGTASISLKNGIPQLAWANYFGEEYVKELDVSLLQRHDFQVSPLGEGYVFNVTDQLEDVVTNYDHFNARRQELKSLFRPDLFQTYARYEHESKPILSSSMT